MRDVLLAAAALAMPVPTVTTHLHRVKGIANPKAPIPHRRLPGAATTRPAGIMGGYHSIPFGQVALDLGGLASKYNLPRQIQPHYGRDPTSFMLFTRLRFTG
jgi:hypothetical protein